MKRLAAGLALFVWPLALPADRAGEGTGKNGPQAPAAAPGEPAATPDRAGEAPTGAAKPAGRPLPAGADYPAWVRLLGDEDWQVREKAAQILQSSGEKALPAVVAALSSTDPEIASRALEITEAIVFPRLNPYGWIGVKMQPHEEGVEVREVIRDTPAEKAGLKASDLITHVNGEPLAPVFSGPGDPRRRVQPFFDESGMLDGSLKLKATIQGCRPGTPVKFKVKRGPDSLDLTIVVGALPRVLPSGEQAWDKEQEEQVLGAWNAWIDRARSTGKPPPLPDAKPEPAPTS